MKFSPSNALLVILILCESVCLNIVSANSLPFCCPCSIVDSKFKNIHCNNNQKCCHERSKWLQETIGISCLFNTYASVRKGSRLFLPWKRKPGWTAQIFMETILNGHWVRTASNGLIKSWLRCLVHLKEAMGIIVFKSVTFDW